MTLHITGGAFKGRKLVAPKGENTRPTKAVVKEAFFNICQGNLSDSLFLDLFAGSGAMGLKALSRGAKQAFFLDHHPQAIEAIKKNIKELELQDKCIVVKNHWEKGIAILHNRGFQFDYIYADPPYHFPLEEKKKLVETLFISSLVKGSLFLEDNSLDLSKTPPTDIRCIKEKKYGKSFLMQWVR